jgi:hypothetical protein
VVQVAPGALILRSTQVSGSGWLRSFSLSSTALRWERVARTAETAPMATTRTTYMTVAILITTTSCLCRPNVVARRASDSIDGRIYVVQGIGTLTSAPEC